MAISRTDVEAAANLGSAIAHELDAALAASDAAGIPQIAVSEVQGKFLNLPSSNAFRRRHEVDILSRKGKRRLIFEGNRKCDVQR